jgi:hypothetical protein
MLISWDLRGSRHVHKICQPHSAETEILHAVVKERLISLDYMLVVAFDDS